MLLSYFFNVLLIWLVLVLLISGLLSWLGFHISSVFWCTIKFHRFFFIFTPKYVHIIFHWKPFSEFIRKKNLRTLMVYNTFTSYNPSIIPLLTIKWLPSIWESTLLLWRRAFIKKIRIPLSIKKTGPKLAL